jgi:hypothetical protein
MLLTAAACKGGSEAGISRPLTVTHAGSTYRVECTEVPEGRLGEQIAVEDEAERRFGASSAVGGRAIDGMPPEAVISVRYRQPECRGEEWVLAFAEGLPTAEVDDLREMVGVRRR